MVWTAAFLVVVVPAAIALALAFYFPSEDDVPRWRTRLADRLDTAADRLRHRRRSSVPDPFLALRVQERLAVVVRHVQQLEADKTVIARAEKIIATQLAYDALLEEACKLAGIEVREHADGDPGERFREEMELAARGWTW